VDASSALSVFRQIHPDFEPTPEQAESFRRLTGGTDLFRRQGLVGDRHLAIAVGLDVHTPAERNTVLAAIDRVADRAELDLGPIRALRRVGEPYVLRMLEDETASSVRRYFPLFGIFLVVLNVFLYRSFRTLLCS
jgi:hypothetical protein